MSIIWLASYPKSGNTWLRAFLTNYLREGEEPANFNELIGKLIAADRNLFDDYIGLESSDMTRDEITRHRPLFYELLAADCKKPFFIKVHDAYTVDRDGQALFPKQATTGVIYIIRNPLDVAVSYAHHENKSMDHIVNRMNSDDYAMLEKPNTLYAEFPQELQSWSSHVRSWVDEPNQNVHVVRYEDMLQQPTAIFTEVVGFSGLTLDTTCIQKAIDFSCFKCLQNQEAIQGFAEKQPTAQSFFRQGAAGSWRERLTRSQVRQLVNAHRPVMDRFGYLLEAEAFLRRL